MTTKVTDLSTIDTVKGADEGFDVQIYNPKTREDMGMIIHVIGEDSDEYKKGVYNQARKQQARMSKGGFRSVNWLPSPEETDQNALNLLVLATKGWRTLAIKNDEGNIVEPEKNTIFAFGKELEFTQENVLRVYGIPAVRDQVAIAVTDRANFIKG